MASAAVTAQVTSQHGRPPRMQGIQAAAAGCTSPSVYCRERCAKVGGAGVRGGWDRAKRDGLVLWWSVAR